MKRSVLMMSGTLLVVFFLASVAMAEETGKMETAIGEVTSVDHRRERQSLFLERWQRYAGCGNNRG